MKLFFSEFESNYQKYFFPYQVYLYKETNDDINKIYDMGFLPTRLKKDLFYLCRSLRVNLRDFELTSENRRVLKKTNYIKMNIKELKDYKYNYKIGKMGKDFYDKRFNKRVMSANKIKWLFTEGFCTHVAVYRDREEIIGYCLLVKGQNLIHYAYPFYDLRYFKKNAGMGMMLQLIIWSWKNGLNYTYLGTCYTEKALYKTQFKGCEYFTGWNWSNDIDELKYLVRNKIKIKKLSEEIYRNFGLKF